jgi:hypothetical protein
LSAATSTVELLRLLEEEVAARNGGTLAESGPASAIGQSERTSPEAEEEGEAEVSEASETGSGTKPLLDYLLGP